MATGDPWCSLHGWGPCQCHLTFNAPPPTVVYVQHDAQRDADAELGRMVRAIYHSGKVLSMSTGLDGCPFIMVGGVLQQERYRTINEAVRRALERGT